MNTGKEIKSKINCIDLAYELNLDITKRGDHYRCKSFIHNGENDMSVIITPDSWYSFSDNVGGDVITMLAYAKYKGDESKAFRELANRFGLSNAENVSTDYLQEMDAIARYVISCHNALRPLDREYLHKRRITDKTIDEFKIGYDSNSDRLIIPIYENNKPVYWCARDRSGNPNASKYTKANLTEHPHRKNIMYGYDTLSNGSDTLIIAEGVFDYLSLHQEGYACLSNATAISNTNIKNVTMLARGFKRVILCFDNDVSGSAFTQRLYPALFKANINFEVCFIPKTQDIKDISDWYSRGMSLNVLFENHTKNGTEIYLRQAFSTYEALVKYVDENAPYIDSDNKIKIREYAKELIFDTEELKKFKSKLNRGKTDNEYANELANHYRGLVRTNPKIGTFIYNGIFWQETEISEIRKTIISEIDNSLGHQRVKAICNMFLDNTFTDELPNEKNCLNLRNGTLYINDYATDQNEYIVFSKQRNPEDFCTYMIDYDYDPKKRFDKLDYFLDTITCYDEQAKQFLIECMGSTLYSDNRLRKAYLFYGEGSNGKSLYETLVREMLGGEMNVSEIPLSDFNERFEIVHLQGKRVNLCHEATSDVKGTESKFKSIVAGEPFKARHLQKESITIKPRCKIFIDCNELPRSAEISSGWRDRFLPYEFKARFVEDPSLYTTEQNNVTSISDWIYENPSEKENIYFKKDPNLERELIAPENLSAVLNLAIEGFISLKKNKDHFTPFGLGSEILETMREESNNVVTFAKSGAWEQYRRDEDGFTPSASVYQLYKNWCENNGVHPFGNLRFSKLFVKELKKQGWKIESTSQRINKILTAGNFITKC